MFEWTNEVIRFRMEASEYNHFEQQLAKRLLPYLPAGAHVCDAGCGLGYLSLALAENDYTVTAVDISAATLHILRENAQARGLTNIQILQDDLFSMRPKTLYDAMVFCFFGRTDETLRAVKRQCVGKAILIKKAWEVHRFTLEKKPLQRFTFRQTCRELEELGIRYQAETFSMETGQPFRSLSDAVRFFELYEKGTKLDEQAVIARLAATESREFPFYLPSAGRVGIIVLDAGEIPDSIK